MCESSYICCAIIMESMQDTIERQAKYIEDLEHELRITRRQLQDREMKEITERRRAAIQFYREEYERKHGPPNIKPRAEGTDVIDCLG